MPWGCNPATPSTGRPLWRCVADSGFSSALGQRPVSLSKVSSRAGLGDLRGGFLVEVIGCTLGMRSCRKDGTVVILENFQPRRDICGVFLSRLLVQFEIGTQEGRSQLGYEFFAAVAFIAPALAAEVTIKALSVFRPVGEFMGEGGVI